MSEGRDSEQPAADGAAASSNQAATRPMAPPSPQASTERLGQDPAAGMLDGELPIGGVLADRYQVLQRLSAGGMGVVYKAKHLALDDIVAIKLLLKPQDETDRKRFLLEARLATRIKHPNTVYVSDFGLLPDGRSYLVMEFMPGQTLSQALKGGKLEPLRACRIAVQIARGLQAVHDLDIVHRDLKPDNIFLLTQDGQPDFVKIVDFGIAKASQLPASLALELPPGVAAPQAGELAAASPTVQLHELAATARNMTMKSAILGTPHYMSPEAIKGKAVDGRADQYALGCVLFQLLSGRLPFREDDLMALLTQHMYEPIPELRLEAPEVPAPLAEIVKKLLAKEPAARYGSMRDVEHALEREIELIMIQRGERAVVSSALAGLLKVQGKGLRAAVMLGGRAVPLWALGPVALLLLVGGAGLGVRFFAPGVGVIKESLRPGELRELRGRALAVLREDLKSGPEALKVGSALVLGQSHDRELRPELEALLRSPSPALRGQAAEGLGQLGDRQLTPVLLTFLEHEQAPQARLGAALALQQLGEPSGAMELDKLLGSGSAQVQLRAALARCEHLPDSARTVLHGFLPRPELPGGARLAILACLGRLGDAEAVAALRSQAQAGVRPAERIAAQVKLAELGDFAAHAALQQLIQRRGPDYLLAARLLAGPEDLSGREAFRSVLDDPGAQPGARRLGAEGLAAIGELFDARALARQLATPALTPELRQSFAAAILLIAAHDPGLMGDDSVAWAVAALGDGDWLARQAAVAVLGDTKGSQARTLLSRALRDADARVRVAAARALGRQLDRDALQLLRAGLDDPDALVRLETLRSLSRVAKVLHRTGARDLLPLMQGLLQPLLSHATAEEKVLALGTLVALGDKERLPALLQLSTAPEPAARKLFVEQLATQTEPLIQLLKDGDPEVRTQAAVRLGALGDISAVPVLTEALGRGGAGALTAMGVLSRMKQRNTTPQELLALFTSAADSERLAAVAAAADLPAELALALLLRAARDPDVQVRQRTAEAAADLPSQPKRPLGWPVLQILVTDKDAAIRRRALALLAELTPQPGPASASADGPSSPAAVKSRHLGIASVDGGTSSAASPAAPADLAVPAALSAPTDLAVSPDLAASSASADPAPPEYGVLMMEGPDFIEVQLDDKKWQPLDPKPLRLPVGEHRLFTLSDAKTVLIRKDHTTKVELKPSAMETGARDGIELFNKQQYDKALRLLERAYSGCEKLRGKQQKGCGPLLAELAYYKGSIFEAQDRIDAAATEYQRVIDNQAQGGRGDSHRGTAKQSLEKLAGRLGLIVFKQTTKKGCHEEKLWVQPGNPIVKLGGTERSVRIRARQTVDLGDCE